MEAIYPPLCCVCGHLFDAPPISSDPGLTGAGPPGSDLFAGIMARQMCPDCAASFVTADSPLCLTCGAAFASRNTTDHVCGECRRVPKYFQSARAAGIYEQSLMTALQRLKYSGRTELAGPLGVLLLAAFLKWFDATAVDLVTPVPLYRRKQRQRGFNQAWLLIRNWCRPEKEGRIFFPRSKLCRNLLLRTRMTRSQTTLSRQERLDNVRGAFVLSDSADVQGQSVLLVDDVYTTGATVNECARVLTAGGAARVDILTAARVKG
jgi:ComF family protein